MSRIKMLSRAATARELGICARTVDNMIRRGEIKAIRIGRRVLIPELALGQALADFGWDIQE